MPAVQWEFNGVQSFQWEFNRVQCPSGAIGCAINSLRGNVLRTQWEFNACGAMGNSVWGKTHTWLETRSLWLEAVFNVFRTQMAATAIPCGAMSCGRNVNSMPAAQWEFNGVQSFQWEFHRVQCPSDAIGCASNSLRGNVLRTQWEFNACGAMGNSVWGKTHTWLETRSLWLEAVFNVFRTQMAATAIPCGAMSCGRNVNSMPAAQWEFNGVQSFQWEFNRVQCHADTIGCANNSLRGNFAIFNKRLEDTIHRACFLSSSISFESALFFLATEL